MTNSKTTEHMIAEVNQFISDAFLRCKYGVYSLDSASKTLRHIHNGIECFYSLEEGIRQIAKIHQELETEDIIHSIAEEILFDAAKSEELGYATTDAYNFIEFEGCETSIYGVPSETTDWSKIDLEVITRDSETGTWYNLARVRDIPIIFESIYLGVAHALKEIRLMEIRSRE